MLFILGVLFASLLFQMIAKYLPQPPGQGPIRVVNRQLSNTNGRRLPQFRHEGNFQTRRHRRCGCIRFHR